MRFQHTAARRRLGTRRQQQPMGTLCFNTQPPEGGWEFPACVRQVICSFNTQPPEGGWGLTRTVRIRIKSFNTQPPEGGWLRSRKPIGVPLSFNTQPPEGGWVVKLLSKCYHLMFQHTAARRRLGSKFWCRNCPLCFNTQPPEGGWQLFMQLHPAERSFNTQPPEGG